MGVSSLVCLLFFGMIKIDGIAPKMFWSVNKFTLIAIPYFIVSGNLMMKGGLARPLLELGYALLKRIDGALPPSPSGERYNYLYGSILTDPADCLAGGRHQTIFWLRSGKTVMWSGWKKRRAIMPRIMADFPI
jgi:hypothetical protein